MAENPRIEELKRRVQKDPASLAFAHLAEEFRRTGRFKEAVETCRAGLKFHPNYLSAKVTLGRALIELGDLDAAHEELQSVMAGAPDNLSAIRGLAEIHQRRGQHQEALDFSRWALEFAKKDPELERQVQDLEKVVEPEPAAPPVPIQPAAAAQPSEAAASAPPPESEAERQLAFFRRFLDAIVADRQRRRLSL